MSDVSSSPSPSTAARGPWLALGLLGVVALGELGLALWQRARTEALLDRLRDVQTIQALELDSRLSLLILLDEQAAGLSFDDLRVMQARGLAWLEDYSQRNRLETTQVELLRGLLARYLADYAGERVAMAVRTPDSPPAPREAELTRRFFRGASHILGEQEGSRFEQEIRAVWGGWLP